MNHPRGYDEWPFLSWLRPFLNGLRRSPEEFPAVAFALFCALIGGFSGYALTKFAANNWNLHWEPLMGLATTGGVAGGVGFAIWFICWLVKD